MVLNSSSNINVRSWEVLGRRRRPPHPSQNSLPKVLGRTWLPGAGLNSLQDMVYGFESRAGPLDI